MKDPTKVVISPENVINKYDWQKIAHNAAYFLAPAVLVLLASVGDLIPEGASWGVVVLYLANILTDAIRKWRGENTYRVDENRKVL